MIQKNYTQAIKTIKQAILKSRYQAALLANREMLMLYFSVGEYISKNSREGKWGTNAIEVISTQLQKELPGLRGFSTTNLRNMRLFYEAWQHVIPDSQIHQLPTDELQSNDNQENRNDIPNRQTTSGDLEMNVANSTIQNHQLLTDDLQTSDNMSFNEEIIIRQLSTDELSLNHFTSIGFTHHIIILNSVKQAEERMFYIEQCAQGFWSVEKLRYNLKSNLYAQLGTITNNFAKTIGEVDFRGRALRSFRHEK